VGRKVSLQDADVAFPGKADTPAALGFVAIVDGLRTAAKVDHGVQVPLAGPAAGLCCGHVDLLRERDGGEPHAILPGPSLVCAEELGQQLVREKRAHAQGLQASRRGCHAQKAPPRQEDRKRSHRSTVLLGGQQVQPVAEQPLLQAQPWRRVV